VSLAALLAPGSVAVVGASDAPGSVGGAVLRNLTDAGFPGPVHPVNPRRAAVAGLPCAARLADIAPAPDLVVICTPAATVPRLLAECGAAGAGAAIVISAGFSESGASGRELERRACESAAAFPGLRVLGPNCLGVIVPRARLNASFAAGTPRAGRLAFVSQSGALCTAVLDWALEEEVGFSAFVSVGNLLDVGFADLLRHLADDPDTDAVLLYAESIRDGRAFVSAARACARAKPVIAYKAGRFADSARAAASHTGAMAGEDDVVDAAFRRAGIERVFELGDLFDTAELLARGRRPAAGGLGVVTNAGGPGVMATDALLARGGRLAVLSRDTLRRLDDLLPAAWSRGNPVDVLGDAPPGRLAAASAIVLEDADVAALLAILAPQAMTDPLEAARGLAAAAAAAGPRPVLAAWMGGRAVRAGVRLLNEAGVPTYSTPEAAVHAFLHLVSWARRLAALERTPAAAAELDPPPDARAGRALVEAALARGRRSLGADESLALLRAYGVAAVRTESAASADEAAARARAIGFPVAAKVLGPSISHKTDVGGVALGLATEADVREAFERIVRASREHAPEAALRGVLIQAMAPPGGLEMIVGIRRDPAFGPALLVGAGGVATEVLHDRALELPPLDARLAREMLASLRCWPLLRGHRGRAPADVDALADVLLRVGRLATDVPEIVEMDVNPVLAYPRGSLAVDARVALALPGNGGAGRPDPAGSAPAA
jgi:acetyltransferase